MVNVVHGLRAELVVAERVAAQRVGQPKVGADLAPEPTASDLRGEGEVGRAGSDLRVVGVEVNLAPRLAHHSEGFAAGVETRFWRANGHQGVSRLGPRVKNAKSALFRKVGGGSGRRLTRLRMSSVRVMRYASAMPSIRWRSERERRKLVITSFRFI